MRCALLLCAAVLAVLASAGCAGGVVTGDGPVELAATDPGLLENAASLVFSFSTKKTCKELIDLGPKEIGDALALEGAPLQVLDPTSSEHVFGKVPPNAPIAYFVLASTKASANERVDLASFAGSVIAAGCRDFTAPSGTRHDLPLTLFPVGLR